MKKRISLLLVFTIIFTMLCSSISVNAAATKTQEEAVNWANNRAWQAAEDKDGMYGAQCVDFIMEYYDYLGVARVGGNARDYAWNALPSGFTRIQDYIGFIPEPGDIAVWTVGGGGDANGHVGVVTVADGYSITVTDVWGGEANTPGQQVRSTTYGNYYSPYNMVFWGVIRPAWANKKAITTATINEDTYTISAAGKYLNASEDWDGGNVNVASSVSGAMQQWKIYKNGSGYYIESVNGGKRELNIYTDGASLAGINVTLWPKTDHHTQRWLFEEKNGSYMIYPTDNTSVALTMQNDGNVNIDTVTGNTNQLWKLESVAKETQKNDDVDKNIPNNNNADNSDRITLNAEIVGNENQAIGIKFDWNDISSKYGYRIFRSTSKNEKGISISDFAIAGDEYVDVNIDSYETYYYSICPVVKEAEFDVKTGTLTSEVLGEYSKTVVIETPEIVTKLNEERHFILMEIGKSTMLVGEETLEIDPGRGTVPVIQNGRTLVPIRAIIEAMGGTVNWNEAERKVTLNANNHNVEMWLGNKEFVVDGVKKEMDIAPGTINDRTMLPIRFVTENVGCQIEWIASSHQVVIVF